jgi:cation diffusion facilitator family transporter
MIKKLTQYAWLSIGAAVVTICLKTIAYFLTGSVGLLSDALESVVNLAAGIMALVILTIAVHPADEDHPYGHSKAEYFSSGMEGALILLAAASICFTAIPRLISPRHIEQAFWGLLVSVLASLVNFGVARILLRAGKRHRSITLEADAHHIMTDVWTSVGVIIGVGAVAISDWHILDPIIALLVALNIVWTGVKLIRRSAQGLMDVALPDADLAAIQSVIERYSQEDVQFHALRTRQAGARNFISVHVLVPGQWTVQQGHQLLEDFETDIGRVIPNVHIITHLEPVEDPTAWKDRDLENL